MHTWAPRPLATLALIRITSQERAVQKPVDARRLCKTVQPPVIPSSTHGM